MTDWTRTFLTLGATLGLTLGALGAVGCGPAEDAGGDTDTDGASSTGAPTTAADATASETTPTESASESATTTGTTATDPTATDPTTTDPSVSESDTASSGDASATGSTGGGDSTGAGETGETTGEEKPSYGPCPGGQDECPDGTMCQELGGGPGPGGVEGNWCAAPCEPDGEACRPASDGTAEPFCRGGGIGPGPDEGICGLNCSDDADSCPDGMDCLQFGGGGGGGGFGVCAWPDA